MSLRTIALLLATALSQSLPAQEAASPTIRSVNIGTDGYRCKAAPEKEQGTTSTQICPGAGGYKLLLLGTDSRASVTLLAPDGRRYPLSFWDVVTPRYSAVEGKVEWRVRMQDETATPVALIVKLDVNEDPSSAAMTRYLVIAKITAEATCVVEKLKASDTTTDQARAAADASADKPCLPSPQSR